MEEKILFDEQKPTKDGKYHTNRGYLEFNVELGHFLDDDGFPIYSDDKIKWWIEKVDISIQSTEKRIGWVKKRVGLSELQEEYFRFILNQQEQVITNLTNQIADLKKIKPGFIKKNLEI